MELAAISDCSKIVWFCHAIEGDHANFFYIPQAFDEWNETQEALNSIAKLRPGTYSNMLLMATRIEPVNLVQRQILLKSSAEKVAVAHSKMLFDSDHRMLSTLLLFRGCRLWSWKFIARTDIVALREELIHARSIPATEAFYSELEKELEHYKLQANKEHVKEIGQLSLWDFWRTHQINLPYFYRGACEVALCMPSSCAVERVFSLLEELFSSSQESSLQDYKEIKVMLRYNIIWRLKYLNGQIRNR
jgi:hypothetical protein